MAITLDRETAKDLIQSKLDGIDAEIETILSTWNEKDPFQFIENSKTGKHNERSVRDGIAMRQLLSDKEKYELLLKEATE